MYHKDHSPHEKPSETRGENSERVRNPHQITVNQHVIPQKHLAEWLCGEKVLSVIDKKTGESLQRAPKDAFVVARLWEQPAEQGMIKSTEDLYQEQLSILRSQGSIKHQIITEYFVMLAARAHCAAKKRPLYSDSVMEPLPSIPTQSELEKDEVDQVHDTVRVFRGISDPHATSRLLVAQLLTLIFIKWRSILQDTVWVPYSTSGEKFILPDSNWELLEARFLALPVSPDLVLMDEKLFNQLTEAGQLTPQDLNKKFREASKRYYVAPK